MRPSSKFSNEQLFCWEQIAKTHRLFRVSHAFAPPAQAARLLPLYALFSVVEEACSAYSDEDLARSRLAWWRQECLGRDPGKGSHPVIRELHRHARLGSHEMTFIARLIEQAESRLDAPPPASVEDLRHSCAAVIRPQIELEMGLCGNGEPMTVGLADGAGARLGAVQLMRESLRRRQAGAWWWLPLDLMARHGVSRAETEHPTAGDSVQALFAEVLDVAGAWDDGMSAIPGNPDQAGTLTHLRVAVALQSSLLSRLQTSRPERFGAEMARTTLGDLFRAWRAARRVNRPK